MKKHQPTVASVMAAVPLTCYGVLFAAACYTWPFVGNWPSYGNPDPSNLPVKMVYTSAIIATLGGMISVFVLPLAELAYFGVRYFWKKEWPPHGKRVIIPYSIGAALWIVSVLRWRYDGGGLVNWIFD